MTTIPAALAIAIEHHRSGRREAAEWSYRQILAIDPGQPDATHYLGVLAMEAGQLQLAAQLMEQSIRINQHDPTFHNNLGLVRNGMNQWDAAIACFRQSVRQIPTWPTLSSISAKLITVVGNWTKQRPVFARRSS